MNRTMSDSGRSDKKLARETADGIAIQALRFIAGDAQLLPRFLDLTGIAAHDIRRAAGEPGFMAGVLQFILAHEPTLIKFSETSGVAPQDVGRALRALPAGDDRYEMSS
ncbi:DUF3572 domain-containing protein [Mesorhizobium sp. YIM 152430]|uniref:DUF3572 domain-containing protein n=1 Tax=Mesorhizobium sp. YIM 152430 TaxID=3031761 RepID=UPI0023DB237B|nr:DUF3572 domain-containing protein [Mesorhizobium sp. YIM 152430]MDF1601371.1 DUF3572 domain-containing protein [Mesorhizobium sp. YIM 152430]